MGLSEHNMDPQYVMDARPFPDSPIDIWAYFFNTDISFLSKIRITAICITHMAAV